MGDFSHLDKTGMAAMVDVSGKQQTLRSALVRGRVQISKHCADKLSEPTVTEIVRTARLAGIQASKQTATLVPLCHQVALSSIDVAITFDQGEQVFVLEARSKTQAAVTGVEMEALCAATIAGVTIYDMVKAVDPGATVGPFALVEKHGGKTGVWTTAND